MDFRTEVKLREADFSISHADNILMCGSCFVENIGKKLIENKFKATVNPFGTLYNPISIQNGLENILNRKQYTCDDLFFYDDMFHSFDHNSFFSSENEDTCLNRIQKSISGLSIKNTDYIILTFGTSYIYRFKQTGKAVSNCHKLPDRFFERQRLTVDEITTDYIELINRLQEENNDLRIIFSVSPIRHWKDGAHENQLSKSVLLLAIDEIQKSCKKTYYFPAYEIVLDELRDYRFYTKDMNHIAEIAIDYIREKFEETFFNSDTKQFIKKWNKIREALQHKPFNPQSGAYKQFVLKNMEALQQLKVIYPNLDIDEELQELKNKAD